MRKTKIHPIILFIVVLGCNFNEKSSSSSAFVRDSIPELQPSKEYIPFYKKEDPGDCTEETMPEYDEIIAKLLDNEGNPYKDTVIERIVKKRDVFKPCRKYVFIATYLDKDGNLISESKISMMSTGKRWKHQPELQDEIIINYDYDYSQSEIEEINKYNINATRPRTVWHKSNTTGIIENVKEIWMHPFRDNQFHFTEVAPFPYIKFPLEIGKTWTQQLNIVNGWGDWNNTTGTNHYSVEETEDLNIKYGRIKGCWKIKSSSRYPFGDSFFDYWFHHELGFVKMNYTNYKGQKLHLELVELINCK